MGECREWTSIKDLPVESEFLKEITLAYPQSLQWQLRDLRLIAGKNFLLLAGLPDEKVVTTRKNLAECLTSSIWKKHIEDRYEYKGLPFPPKIWHTTLCRYQRDILPKSVQALYEQYKEKDFGDVDLGTPALRAINYDWSCCESLPPDNPSI